MTRSLPEIRQQIDAVDAQLLALLNQRAALANEVGHIKRVEGSPVFRPEREAAVIRGLQERNEGPLRSTSLAPIWREIMSACRALEAPQRVAFLGPAGTFSELHDSAASPSGRAALPIGFGERAGAGRPRRLRVEDLASYGMLHELLGRLPVRVQLRPLGEEELCQILTEPRDALLREYTQLLELDGVKLEIEPSALREIARAALRQGTGARGLRSLVEAVCHDLMFEAPERRGETVRLDAARVRARLEDESLRDGLIE